MAAPLESPSTTAADLIRDSVFAGLLGASAVAVVFLIIDLMDGQPLFTPSLIGSVLFLGVAAEDVTVQFDAIAYYSIAHILSFALLGTAIAVLVHEVELHSRHPIVVWLVLFAIIEVGFYVVASLALPGVIERLGVVRVAVANLVAAGAIAAFFWFYHRAAVWEKLKFTSADLIFDAFYSGAIGGSAVGLFFLLVDSVVEGDPLFTPSLMGSVLALGIAAEDVVEVNLKAVAIFMALHMVLFAALGMAISFLVHEVELHSRHPAVVLAVFFAIIEVGFYALASLALPGVIERLGVVRIGVANLVSAAAMTAFFVWSYRQTAPEAEQSAPS